MFYKVFVAVLLISTTLQFKTSLRTQITPLESILAINPTEWTCDNPSYKVQLGAQHDVEMWIDIVKHKDGFDGDLQVLAMVKALVDRVLLTVQHIENGQGAFVQMRQLHHSLSKNFKMLSQIESSWYDINDILGYLEVLNKAKSDEDKLQLAATIATKISELIQQITEIQLQLNTIPVEIDQLYDLATRVNEKTAACQDEWASSLEADRKAEEEEKLKEEQEEQARLQAEEEAKAAAEAAAELERQKEEEARQLEEWKNSEHLTPEEAQLLEDQAEKELELAEELEQETSADLEAAQQAEHDAEEQATQDAQAAQEAAEKAAQSQEELEQAQQREEEACVDADEAARRLKEAQDAAEEAKRKLEEAQRLAEEAKKVQECEPVPEPEVEEVAEEEVEEEWYSEEEDSCTDEALEDLIDTLIDAANEPSAFQPSCGYPGCQEQPIIIIVEDDEDEPQPQPDVEPEPEVEPTPDDVKISEEEAVVEEEVIITEETFTEEQTTEEQATEEQQASEEQQQAEEESVEEIIYEEIIYEEIIYEEVTEEEEEEEDDDDIAQMGFPLQPEVDEIQYLIYKTDEKYDNTYTQDKSPWDVEVTHGDDTKIKGSTEYSYGLWTYFRYNGVTKISQKTDVLAVGGLSGDDTDRLVTLIGTGVYQFKVAEGDPQEVDYGKYLDGEWVYIYFGYKETQAKGYVYWARQQIIKSVAFTVTYEKIIKTIKFTSGYYGSYKSFNGIITNIRVVLNKDSFIEDEVLMKNAIESEYPAPTTQELESVEKQYYEKVEYEGESADPAFTWDLDGYREYSVSTWFRYVRRSENALQLIFRLTSNEPDSGVVAHGENVLSLWQTENNDYEFRTYTVEDKDQFSDITEPVQISQESQQLWTYAYFGLQEDNLNYYIEWPDSSATKQFKGWHVVAKYWALYLGRQTKYYFFGKTHYTTIRFGKGAWTLQWSDSDNYKIGREKLWPGVQLKSYDAKWVTYSQESEYDTLLHEEQDWVTDGVYEYGFGLWTKFFITNPSRIYEKPDRILIARLGFDDSDTDVLGTYIGRGSYEFQAGAGRPIQYGKNLDGYWNYIYFSYSKLRQIAVGYVNFNKLSQVQRTVYDAFDADPANNYVRFYVGNWRSIYGFNGRIASAVVRLGRGSFINEIDEYTTWMEQYKVPVEADLGTKDYEVQGADDKDTTTYETFLYEDSAAETAQYSVYGWFKYYGDLQNTDAQTIIRLTNNEVGHVQDATILGDRTLSVIQQGGNMILSTYDIGYIDTDFEINRSTQVELGEYRGIWMYIWIGYSRTDEYAGWFLGYPDTSASGVFRKTLHFSPKYLAVYFGKDGINKDFNGKSRHVHACYGSTQCWYFVNKPEVEEQLPAWIPYKLNNYFEFYVAEDSNAYVEGLDVEFTQTAFPGSDIEAINEYGIGLWTRWLQNYPFILLDKSDSHSIFRFTTNAQYQDSDLNGDRTLSAFVGRGEYTFSTYDAVLNKNEISTGVKYDKQLEGYWNFVYFCYKRILGAPTAIGYVYFSNLNIVKRVEINSVKHWLLRDYARLVVGKKEFQHESFQGRLFDVRAFLGKSSYIETSEDLVNTLIPKFRPRPPYKDKQDNEPVFVDKATIAGRTFKQYETKYSGVFEYSVYGFAKGNKKSVINQFTTLVRVTQNTADIQKDNTNAGDRSLAIFANTGKWIYSTYDYGDLETKDDDNGSVDHEFSMGTYWGKWTYFYFGYSFKLKQAYAYIRQIDQTENSYLFEEVYQFVPNYLSVFFAEDGYGKQFSGDAFDWYLGIGDGAFTLTPEPGTWPVDPAPPPDRILSALLANQGFNSGRIVKPGNFLQLEGTTNLIELQKNE